MPSRQEQQKCARDILPFLAWICGITVALGLRYGYYGNHHLVLGPNSSRMLKASSVFVEEVQVRDEKNNGLWLYGFEEPPELSLETNWTISNNLFINSYSRQGFSMWLNRGSKVWMAWEVTYGSGSYEYMHLVVLKGEQQLKELHRFYTRFKTNVSNLIDVTKEAEYKIEEDDSYYIGIVNLNPWSMVATLKINVSSKTYDTTEATSICSTSNGLCKLDLLFPNTRYFVLATPNNDMPTRSWSVELSFVARMTAYFVIVGCVVVIIYMILNHLGAYESDRTEEVTTHTETDPIVPIKDIACTYRTTEEDPTSSLCCSSEDLYDNKICAICYDEMRNCFFIPCGHSATCYTCAQRIMDEENKVCPICRRLIHKVRRLLSP